MVIGYIIFDYLIWGSTQHKHKLTSLGRPYRNTITTILTMSGGMIIYTNHDWRYDYQVDKISAILTMSGGMIIR